jgi:hypothetical protein
MRDRDPEDDPALEKLPEPPERQVGGDDLEERADGPEEHDIELAGADLEVQVLDVPDEEVGDRERHAREPVEERDLPQRPAAQRGDVREQHEHDDEVDEVDAERRDQVDDERDAVLESRSHLRADEAAVERERAAHVGAGLSHPAPPACATPR